MLRRNRKRARVEDVEEDVGGVARDGGEQQEDEFAGVDDTVAAVELLMHRHRNGFANLGLPPVVLRHQLYTILTNRTFVDQNVNRLKQSGVLVSFRVPTGADEMAIMRLSDYRDLLAAREAEMVIVFDRARTDADDKRVAALAAFRAALPEIAKLSAVTMDTLVNIFSVHDDGEAGTMVYREHVGELQRMGFLMTTARLDEQGFQLSLPRIGQVVTAVKKTRASLVQTLQRTKYKEAFEHQLKKLKRKHTVLEFEFHLADMDGSGIVKCTKVPSGTLVSLVRQ